MKKVIAIGMLITLLISCNGTKTTQSKEKDNINAETQQTEKELIKKINQLTIEGKDIWVREKPFNGEVIMKLNTGDVCKIIKKGEETQLNNIIDHWYKISYKEKTGWVFGSQTNLKTNKTIKIEDFSDFLKDFVKNNHKEISNKYLRKDIGSQVLSNPGVFCILYQSKERTKAPSADLDFFDIYKGEPKGDFCEGYPNVKDGFYYWKTSVKKLPYYADLSNEPDVVSKQVRVPDIYQHNQLYKVLVIKEEYFHSYMFFINIGTSWYLVCEDYCDCSA
jgi:hypothetical protein